MRRRSYQTFQRALILTCIFLVHIRTSSCAIPEPTVRTSPLSFGTLEPQVVASIYRPSSTSSPILVIGDSLSVGKFGEILQMFLLRQRPPSKLQVYASCGSSPENWLADTPVFVTPCGFRSFSAERTFLTEYKNGRRPQQVKTPKINQIYARFKPQTIIIQQGTNWMDDLVKKPDPGGVEHKSIIRRFISQLRNGREVQIVWILPYDASKYPARVKDSVDQWIKESAREMGFQTINSRSMTSRYIPGKSGGDGVHLSEAAATEWANAVIKNLYRVIPLRRQGTLP
jgi:hypothetical protein